MSEHDVVRRIRETRGRMDFLGLPIDRLSLQEMVQAVDDCITAGGHRRIVVINAAKLVRARQDPELMRIIRTADLVGCDGMPLVFASRLWGDPLPGRVNGTDLMEGLLSLADRRRYRVFLLGPRERVVDRTADAVREKFPGVVVAGTAAATGRGFREGEEAALVERIREARADLLFVALPTPWKEHFIRDNLTAMQVGMIHGVGGSFDMLTGEVPRAPRWMQRCGLEWAFRWWKEPLRMTRRNLKEGPLFLMLVAWEWVRRRVLRRRAVWPVEGDLAG